MPLHRPGPPATPEPPPPAAAAWCQVLRGTVHDFTRFQRLGPPALAVVTAFFAESLARAPASNRAAARWLEVLLDTAMATTPDGTAARIDRALFDRFLAAVADRTPSWTARRDAWRVARRLLLAAMDRRAIRRFLIPGFPAQARIDAAEGHYPCLSDAQARAIAAAGAAAEGRLSDATLLRLLWRHAWSSIERERDRLALCERLERAARPFVTARLARLGRWTEEAVERLLDDAVATWLPAFLADEGVDDLGPAAARALAALGIVYVHLRGCSGVPGLPAVLGGDPRLGPLLDTLLDRLGGLPAVLQVCGLTADSVVPYAVLFAMVGINPTGIAGMDTDALHGCAEVGMVRLVTAKPRARGDVATPPLDLGDEMERTIPRAFLQLRTHGERIRAWLPPGHPGRTALFVAVTPYGQVVPLDLGRLRAALRRHGDAFFAWAAQESEAPVAPFRLSLMAIRCSAIATAFLKADLDHAVASRVAGHRRRTSAIAPYIDRRDLHAAMDLCLRRGQDAMVHWARAGLADLSGHAACPPTGATPHTPTTVSEGGAGDAPGRTANGRARRRTTAIMPKQEAAPPVPPVYRMAWATDPRAIVIADAWTAARLLAEMHRIQAAEPRLRTHAPERWRSVWLPLLLGRRAILDQFPPPAVAAGAALLAEHAIPLPEVT